MLFLLWKLPVSSGLLRNLALVRVSRKSSFQFPTNLLKTSYSTSTMIPSWSSDSENSIYSYSDRLDGAEESTISPFLRNYSPDMEPVHGTGYYMFRDKVVDVTKLQPHTFVQVQKLRIHLCRDKAAVERYLEHFYANEKVLKAREDERRAQGPPPLK